VQKGVTPNKPRYIPHFNRHAFAGKRWRDDTRLNIVQAINAAIPEDDVTIVQSKEAVGSEDAVSIRHGGNLSNWVQTDAARVITGANAHQTIGTATAMHSERRIQCFIVGVRKRSNQGL
jgi:hypothetical protein